MASQEEIQQELEVRRCEANVFYFLENYWHIKVPGGSPLFALRPPQRTALEAWEAGLNTISLKARQIGWSTLAAGYAGWKILFHDDTEVVMLSRTQKVAKDLLDMTKYGYQRLPDWMQARLPEFDRQNMLQLEFKNGSGIESMPSRENAARGTTASLIIADEWAFFNDPSEAWSSIEPATDVGGQIIGISTANGYGNWFHEFYKSAKAGVLHNWKAMFFPWNSIPERDEQWYKTKVRNMEPWQLAQEYPTTDEEAFIASGNPVYDHEMLQQRVDPLPPTHTGGLGLDVREEITFMRSEDGGLRLWELPEEGNKYVIGADVASGTPDGDFSTATVIEARSRRVVAVFRERMFPEDFAESLDRLGRWYNRALLGPERNTHGLVVIRLLTHDLSYPNLYNHRRENETQSSTRNVGWYTSATSKPILVDDLGSALRRGKLMIHCDETLTELIAFSRRVSQNGVERFEGKPHDDLVISLAIANQLLKEVVVPTTPDEDLQPGQYNLNFLERVMNDQARLVAGAQKRHYTAGYRTPGASKPAGREVPGGFIVYSG